MKIRVNILSNGKKIKSEEIVIPNKNHLQSQIKYPARVFESKKNKLYRKRKHKIDPKNYYGD